MTIRYIAPIADSSGYANAARNNIAAMVKAGIKLTIEPISFEKRYADHGKLSKLINNHIHCQSKWDINLIHATPENWPRLRDPKTYNIGYTVWETDKLPSDWVKLINSSVNEVWVPTQWNKEVFIASGITKPIKVIPHTLDISVLENKYEPLLEDNKYKFYSIFQWTERKNAINLIKAYFNAFTSENNVSLLLKTYYMGWDETQQSFIKNKIKELKAGRTNLPEIKFIGGLLSGDEINRIHATGDCFYLPHRGEGFGIPIAEAMMFGKPVITTNWSGNLEFTKPDFSYLCDYKLESVGNMPWGKYTSDQNWANPTEESMVEMLRKVYASPGEAKLKGLQGQEYVKEHLSHEKIGQLIKQTLESITYE